MTRWDEITSSDKWMALNTNERKLVRQAYFDQNIKPNIPRGREPDVWGAFERRTQNSIIPQTRTPWAVANDVAIETANAAAGGVKAASDFVSPGNPISRGLDDFIKSGERSQSDTTRTGRAQFQRALSESKGIGDDLGAVKDYVVENPLMAISQTAGNLAIPVGTIKGATAGSRLLGLGARGQAAVGTAAGMGTGGALSGGDAAGGAYEAVEQIPADVLMRNKDVQDLLATLRGNGDTSPPTAEELKTIRHEIGTRAARDASIVPALFGVATGAFGAERLLAGRGGMPVGLRGAALTGLSEAVQETGDEMLSQYSGQRAAQRYDPSIDPMKNVWAMGALGGLQGGLGGVAVGATHRQSGIQTGGSIDGRYGDIARQREQEQAAEPQEVPRLLPPEPIIVDAQGNATTAAERTARARQAEEMGLTPDVQRAAGQYQQGRQEETQAYPALPAPAITVDSQGNARTTEQRNAEVQESFAREQERENLGLTDDVQNAGQQHPAAIRTEIDARASEANTAPTDGQKEAGNYRMGHLRVNGMDISIENPAGSTRSGVSADGTTWSNTMPAHYGYLRNTRGADGDHVDVFIKPGTENNYDGQVYVISQKDPATGKFDEVKAMLGYESQQEAEQAYRLSYDQNWDGMMGVTPMDVAAFKNWVYRGRTKQPRALPFKTDILSKTGKPFMTRNGAQREAARHENAEVVMLSPGQFVVRPAQAPAPQNVQATPAVMPDTGTTTQQSDLTMQNRDRSRPASIEQMNRIAANPDYDRLGIGRSPNEAAPLVSIVGNTGSIPESDMGRSDRMTLGDGSKIPFRYAVVDASDVLPSHTVDGGVNAAYYEAPRQGQIRALNNGRVAGLQGAYQRGTAAKYQLAMINDATAHGVSADVIMGKDQPILVRVYDDAENQRPNIGALSNPQSNLGMSASEQAANDARVIDMGQLDGNIDAVVNKGFLDAFAARLQRQGEDLARIKDASGAYSRQFIERAKAAIFYKAYGDETLTAMMSEDSDPELKNIINAMSMAAPEFAQVDAGLLDMRPQLVQAVHQIREARARGLKLEQFIAQTDMFGRDPLTDKLTQMLWENTRSPKRLAEGLRETAKFIHNEQVKSTNEDMFGGAQMTADDIVSKVENTIREQHGQETGNQQSLNLAAAPGEQGTAQSDGQRGQQNPEQRGETETSRRPPEVTQELTKQPRHPAGVSVLRGNKKTPTESRRQYEHVTETPQFKKWFGKSKIVDSDGKPLKVYHGTGNSDSIFNRGFNPELTGKGNDQLGSGFYFTTNPKEAEIYETIVTRQNQNDNNKLGGNTSPQTIDAYLSIQKPIYAPQGNLLEANINLKKSDVIKILRYSESAKDNENSPFGDWFDEYWDVGVKDWMYREVADNYTGNSILSLEGDFFKNESTNFREALHDVMGFDGVVSEYNNGTKHIVAWFPEQIKSASKNNGQFNAKSVNILESRRTPANDNDLIITHNLTEKNLLHAKKMGGLPVPSLAVTRKDTPLRSFGEITLIGSKEMADPKGYARTKVYGADIYSPRYPSVERKLDAKELNRLRRDFSEAEKLTNDYLPDRQDLEQDAQGKLEMSAPVMVKFLQEKGLKPEIVYQNGSVERGATRGSLRNQLQSNHLENEFSDYVSNLADSITDSERIFQGFTYSGNRKYRAHTLENVVSILKKELRGGEGFNYGVGSLRSKFTPQFKSISQIKQSRDRLVDAKTFEQVKNDITEELLAISRVLDVRPETTISIMEDAPKMGLKSAAKSYDVDLGDATAERIANFLNELRSMPAEYFEAKILRDVGVTEFSGAIVPQGTSEKALQYLRDQGITDIRTYKDGDEADRAKKIAEFEHLFFSLRNRPTKGIATESASQAAKSFMQKLPGASRLKVTVVRSPHDIQSAYRPSSVAEGVYYPNGDQGSIYLVAGNLDSVDRLHQVLAHEVIGHYGVEAFLGDKFAEVVADVQRIGHAPAGAKVTGREKPGDKYYATLESVQKLYGDVSVNDQAREVLARMAETRSKPTFLATVYAKIRAALRSLGLDLKLTTADLRQMVADAGRFLQQGNTRSGMSESRSAVLQPSVEPAQPPQPSKPRRGAADIERPGEGISNAERRLRERALGKIGAFAGKDTIQERLARIRERWQEKAIQGVFDQFAPLSKVSPTAFMQARLSKGSAGAVEYLIRHGAVKLTDGAIDAAGGKGFAQILADLKGEHDHFLAWIAGNRADRLASEWEIVYDNGQTERYPSQAAAREAAKDMTGVKLRQASREHLFTADDIDTLKKLNLGRMADGRSRKTVYEGTLKELNALQRSVLDVAQNAGLINKDSRALWEGEFYVPFYRVMEEDSTGVMGPGQIGGLVGQRAFKKLSGGTEKLGDLAGNTVSNWDHLLGASMRNMAAQNAMKEAIRMGIAEKVGSAIKDSVRVMEDGKEAHYLVDDPLVMDALTALNFVGYKDPFMKVMRTFKHALTMGVTISPTFRIRNLLRDSFQAIAIDSNIKLNPVANIINGWGGTKENSDTMQRLLAGGGAIRFGSFTDGQGIGVKRMAAELNTDPSQIITSPTKLANLIRKTYDLYQETGDRAETINRAAIYQAARQQGKTHLEASYAARDLMDFTAGGKFAAIRILSQVLPFFNARLQGMYKLGRGAAENPKRFWAVTGAIGLASALLYLTMKDDDDYKALPDWARNSYWIAKLPGTDKMIYIPKPFEVGALGSIVERGTELAFGGNDYKINDFAKAVAGIIGDQLAMNPIPQAMKPALEVAFNYDTFRDQPIDSMSQQRVLPQDRYSSSTSAGAIMLGRTLGVSPKKIEHLARGYFGWIGTQALNASDYLIRPLTNLPDNPKRDLSRIDNWFVVGDFIKEADPVSSKYVQRFYDEQREINQVYAAFNQAKASGDIERVKELLASGKLEYRQFYAGVSKQLAEISQQIKKIENSDLPMDQKQARLNELYRVRNQLTMMADERLRERQSQNK